MSIEVGATQDDIKGHLFLTFSSYRKGDVPHFPFDNPFTGSLLYSFCVQFSVELT